jgi:hypothetical protein
MSIWFTVVACVLHMLEHIVTCIHIHNMLISCWWSCRWGETTFLNYSHQRAYCSSPGDIWAWRTMVEWCRQKKTPDSYTRALWQFYHQSDLIGSRRNGQRELWIWPCELFLFILASDFVNAVKPYDMGPPALLLLRRKLCCRLLSP